MTSFLRQMEDWSKFTLVLLALTLVFVVFIVDIVTGFELAFSIFYLLPVAVASWFVSRTAGILFAVMSAVLWYQADLAAGHVYSHPSLAIWNATVRLGFFLIVTSSLSMLRADSIALARARQRQEMLARRDPLTGLRNSTGFFSAAERMLARMRRGAQPVALLYLDMDDQRSFNNHFGRKAGDRLLAAVGEAITKDLPKQHLAARIGGDEFVFLLRKAGADDARAFANTLRVAFRHLEVKYGRPVRASIGVVASAAPPEDVTLLLNQAEHLMYAAKDAGKDQTRIEVVTHAQGVF